MILPAHFQGVGTRIHALKAAQNLGKFQMFRKRYFCHAHAHAISVRIQENPQVNFKAKKYSFDLRVHESLKRWHVFRRTLVTTNKQAH